MLVMQSRAEQVIGLIKIMLNQHVPNEYTTGMISKPPD